VAVSNTSPSAVSPMPSHSRGPTLEAEDALSEHSEDDETAGDHRLHERKRGKREGGDMQQPRARGDQHAKREPTSNGTDWRRCGPDAAS
jgi:hypothetical protein